MRLAKKLNVTSTFHLLAHSTFLMHENQSHETETRL